MALKRKLSEEERDLLIVLEDPVFFTEFMRSTNDADAQRNTWPADKFVLRPYQRELITDQTENILLKGGRSIGKCQPMSTQIWTPDGYRSIGQLLKKKSFTVYALASDNTYVLRRATITADANVKVYTITTSSNRTIRATAYHKLLTDTGWVDVRHLTVGDSIASIHRLPDFASTLETVSWNEARLLGYVWQNVSPLTRRGGKYFVPRYKAIKDELLALGKELYLNIKQRHAVYYPDEYAIRKLPTLRGMSTLTRLLLEVNCLDLTTRRRSLSLDWLMPQTRETRKAFIEALFAQYGEFTKDEIKLRVFSKSYADDVRALLLTFGIRLVAKEANVTRIKNHMRNDNTVYDLVTDTLYDARLFWKTFKLPGVAVGSLKEIQRTTFNEHVFFEEIVSIERSSQSEKTFAVHVYDAENYIAGEMVSHNSVILEDKILFSIFNADIEFPKTSENVLATANVAQMTPILDRVINRFRGSPLLESFIEQINRSKGTLDFNMYGRRHRMHARIAGSTAETNMVGLHIPKVIIDEVQIFPQAAFTQLQPAINR